jgi:hypothetical protein
MAVKANPFESSFENLTTKASGAAKKTVKAVGDAAVAAASDVRAQVTGNYDQKSLVDEMGLNQVSTTQQQQIQQQQQQLTQQTRANLEQINAAIKRARDERLKKDQERKKQIVQAEQKKQAEEKQKQEDPLWKRLLKGKMGSREQSKNAGG